LIYYDVIQRFSVFGISIDLACLLNGKNEIMFIVGFFTGLLFLLLVDVVAGVYVKRETGKSIANNSK